ncbi:polyprenyl synthetase family protein [Streptomyces sp. FIT100]|uniref:polyprenyl synthetase family protein n=1 Tax=Streptomyces sp. FIT100 TaxID=2837956 RepID=UPI0021C8851E|nr:polyprenyl synthetase family protein [Streptomyces sp. FIT100]UUN26329.1 polyprenyl synthetase family protein [Streptomyces sp. FIT100]
MSHATVLGLDLLARAKPLVEPALKEAVAGLHPTLARMSGYAFGWCAADGSPAPAPGGKAVRSALALLAAQAAGGTARDAIPAAVAVELVHGFSLVHDDIMDGDEIRRGRPTLRKKFGSGPAVLAGDAMMVLALKAVARTGVEASYDELVHALDAMARGQAEDIAFESRPFTGPAAVTVDEYLAMARDKTGALLGCAAGMGAAIAGADPDAVAAYRLYGSELGLAFQIVDDILGIWGDPHRTGKPVGCDLVRGKKTLPVLEALACGDAASTRLARLLPRRLTSADLRTATSLIELAGGRRHAGEHARTHYERALCALGSATPRPGPADDLAGLADYLLHRSM